MSNTAVALDAETRGTARRLIGRAVHRHRSLSKEGLAERLFTLLFSGLVYPQIWEDPVVDLAALEIEPHHYVVTIASGGCNVLSYLVAEPAKVTAVDLNHAHVALTKLKLAGIRHLPSHGAFYRFFGAANERANLLDYHRHIEPNLDPETAAFWSSRGPTGRRRIALFRRDLYRHGVLGKFIGAAHYLSRSYGVDLHGLLAARDLAEQQLIFDRDIAPLFDKPLVRWLTRRPSSLFGLGIPPAQYLELAGAGDGDITAVLRDRARRLACGFALADNYFAWQAFARHYPPEGSGSLPLYLQARNFSRIRAGASNVEVHRTSMTDALAGLKASSVDRFVLLDAQDWMGKDQLDALWVEITRTARPQARVIFRTAGNRSILTGRLDDAILKRWRYEEGRSLAHGASDRSAIYGAFHLYTLPA